MRRSLPGWRRTNEIHTVLGAARLGVWWMAATLGRETQWERRGGTRALRAVEIVGTSTMRERDVGHWPPAGRGCPQFPQAPVYAWSGGGRSVPNGLFTGAVIHAKERWRKAGWAWAKGMLPSARMRRRSD